MDKDTQQNAALVEESTAASHSMSEQAQLLIELTSFFKVGDDVKMTTIKPKAPEVRAQPPKQEKKPVPVPEPDKAVANTEPAPQVVVPQKVAASSNQARKYDGWEEF